MFWGKQKGSLTLTVIWLLTMVRPACHGCEGHAWMHGIISASEGVSLSFVKEQDSFDGSPQKSRLIVRVGGDRGIHCPTALCSIRLIPLAWLGFSLACFEAPRRDVFVTRTAYA